jgi:hypothetical protein
VCIDIVSIVREGERADFAIAIFEDWGERRVLVPGAGLGCSGKSPDVSLHPERIGKRADTSNTSMLNLSSLILYRP